MPFPYDRYPWLNFQELNLAYFIRHFQEIFEQWTQLLADQEAWKAATEQDLEDWKTDTLGALEVWKTETETSIEGWESTTLAALTAWQTAAEAAFEAIRVQAAASATAAAGSATTAQAAQTAAEAAKTAAETAAASVTASAAQITANAQNINDLQLAVNLDIYDFQALNWGYYGNDLFSSGYIKPDGSSGSNVKNAKSVYFDCATIAAIKIPLPYQAKLVWYSTAAQAGYIQHDDHNRLCGEDHVLWITPPQTAHYFRIQLAKQDLSDISAEDRTALTQAIIFYAPYQKNSRVLINDEIAKLIFNRRLKSSYNRINFTIVSGSGIDNAGNIYETSRFARTPSIGSAANTIYGLELSADYVIALRFYNGSTLSSVAFIGGSSPRFDFDGNRYYFKTPAGASYMAFTFHRTDYADITDADVNAISASLKLFRTDFSVEQPVYTNSEQTTTFLTYMGKYAEKLGLSDSDFTSASGFTGTSISAPQDLLKLGIAVCGNPKAMDYWSLHDQSFYIAGSNQRVINVVANGYTGWENEQTYKRLGGKGGSLASMSGYARKAYIGIHNVAGTPVLVSLMGKGTWVYNNILDCVREVCRMISESLSGQTPTEGSTLSHLASNGGYCGIPLPIQAPAYENSYAPEELLTLPNAVYHNPTSSNMTASTAKTLTMLCALDVMDDPLEIVTVGTSDLVGGSGSTMYAGDKLCITDAIKIMMMESNNALAETVGRYVGLKLLRLNNTLG